MTITYDPQNDFYDHLGIDSSATEKEIRSAFAGKALELHPDRNKGSKRKEDKFIKLQKVYEVLSDASKKATYDAERVASIARKKTGATKVPPTQNQSPKAPPSSSGSASTRSKSYYQAPPPRPKPPPSYSSPRRSKSQGRSLVYQLGYRIGRMVSAFRIFWHFTWQPFSLKIPRIHLTSIFCLGIFFFLLYKLEIALGASCLILTTILFLYGLKTGTPKMWLKKILAIACCGLVVLNIYAVARFPVGADLLPQTGRVYVKVTATRLNVRSGPGTQNPAIEVLIEDTKLEVLEEEGQWLKVNVPTGISGFVHRDYVR